MTTSGHEPEQFETTDWQARPIQISAVAIAVFLAIALILSALTVKLVVRHRVQTDEPAVFASKRLPPGPRLQTDEAGDLAAYRQKQHDLLSSYGWVNPADGRVRIPIERAMELTLRDLGGRSTRGSK